MVFKESLWDVARVRKGHEGWVILGWDTGDSTRAERPERHMWLWSMQVNLRKGLFGLTVLEVLVCGQITRGWVVWSAGPIVFRPLAKQGIMNDKVMERDADLLAIEKKREKEGGNKVCKWTKDKTIFQRHSPNDQLPLTRPHLLRAHQPMNSMVGWALNILASSWTNHLLVTPSARRQAFNLRMSFFEGWAHIWYLNLNTMWWPTPPGDSTRMKDATDEATSPWSSKNHDPKWQFPYLKHVHRHTVSLPTWNRLTEYSLSMRREIS